MRKALALSAVLALPLIVPGCTRTDTLTTSSPPAAAQDEGIIASTARGGRPASTGTVFVTSQGLYYDTFVAKDPLPMRGKFQLLVNGTTEFGPGDPEYLGGRWWEDLNQNGTQDEG